MAKYKVGNIVIVKKSLNAYENYAMDSGGYSNTIAPEMLALTGRPVTIKHVDLDGYYIKELGFTWTDEMFSGLKITNTFETEE